MVNVMFSSVVLVLTPAKVSNLPPCTLGGANKLDSSKLKTLEEHTHTHTHTQSVLTIIKTTTTKNTSALHTRRLDMERLIQL